MKPKPQYAQEVGIRKHKKGEAGEKSITAGIKLKLTKTDQAGEQSFEKTFIAEKNLENLSKGKTIMEMLERANRWGGEKTPLFRNNEGKEIKYKESCIALTKALIGSNLDELTRGTQSPRIGGATAYAYSPSGGAGSRLHGAMAIERQVRLHTHGA